MKITLKSCGVVINGHLVDVNQIVHWHNHTTWGAHTPFQAIKKLEKLLALFRETPDEIDLRQNRIDLLFYLSNINCYGYHIPDDVFRSPPTEQRYWRVAGGHTQLGKPLVVKEGFYEIK